MQMLDYQKMIGKRFITTPVPPRATLEEDAGRITQFGLTQNQAKIYLAVLRLGTTQVEPISKISSVRREDIYRILPRLYELGIVERVIGSPTRVRAIPIERAVRILVRNRQEVLNRESAGLEALGEDFLEYFDPAQGAVMDAGEREQFSITEGKHAIQEKIRRMLEGSENEILASVSDTDAFSLLADLPRMLEGLPDRGMRIRIITEASRAPLISALLKGLGPRDLDFRLNGLNGGNYLVSDAREAIVITSAGRAPGCSSLWTNDASFISLLLHDFDTTWAGAPGPYQVPMTAEKGAGNQTPFAGYPL